MSAERKGEIVVCDCAPDCAERIACQNTGAGHSQCGWCALHNQARHICFCPHERHTPPGQADPS